MSKVLGDFPIQDKVILGSNACPKYIPKKDSAANHDRGGGLVRYISEACISLLSNFNIGGIQLHYYLARIDLKGNLAYQN